MSLRIDTLTAGFHADTLDTFMRSLGHDVVVDHRAPLHDRLCRCRACKPPRVGETSQTLTRVAVAAAIGGITTAAIVGGHAARAGGLL